MYKPSYMPPKKANFAPAPRQTPALHPTIMQVCREPKMFLRRWDIQSINVARVECDGKRVGIIGSSGSGKSVYVKSKLKMLCDIPLWLVYNPSEAGNHNYGPHMVNDALLHTVVDMCYVDGLKRRQEHFAAKYGIMGTEPLRYEANISAGLVLDDVGESEKQMTGDTMKWVLKTSRNFKLLMLYVAQYHTQWTPPIRNNLSHVVMFHMNTEVATKALYEHFFTGLGSYRVFQEICGVVMQNRGCLVVDLASTSKKIEDRFFWDRCDELPGDFKIGSRELNTYQEQLYDKNWRDKYKDELDHLIEKMAHKSSLGKGKSSGVPLGVMELLLNVKPTHKKLSKAETTEREELLVKIRKQLENTTKTAAKAPEPTPSARLKAQASEKAAPAPAPVKEILSSIEREFLGQSNG